MVKKSRLRDLQTALGEFLPVPVPVPVPVPAPPTASGGRRGEGAFRRVDANTGRNAGVSFEYVN